MTQDENEELYKEFAAERLHWAVQLNDKDEVIRLLDSQEDINRFDEMGWTALHHAAKDGNLEMMQLLINRGANIDAQDSSQNGNTPLGEIAANCSLEVATLLINSGADPSKPGWMRLSALDRAKTRKKPEGIKVYQLLLNKTAKF